MPTHDIPNLRALRCERFAAFFDQLSDQPEIAAHIGVSGKPKPSILHPVTGWVLHPAAELDDARPGFLLALSRLPPAHRQTIFFAFALRVHQSPGPFLEAVGRSVEGDQKAALADELLRAKPPNIVEWMLGMVPGGFVSALAKIELDPLADRDSYHRLFHLFADRCHRRRCIALLHGRSISDEAINVVWRLDDCLLHQKVLARVREPEEAERLCDAISILRDFVSTATGAAIEKAVTDLGERTLLRQWLGRWIERADRFPEPPFETDPSVLVPLRSGSDMVQAGRVMQNCLASKITSVLAGRCYFYRYEREGGAVAVLTKLGDSRWLLTSVHGWSNGPVHWQTDRAIRAELQRVGCLALAEVEPRFKNAARLFSQFALGELDDDLGDDLEGLVD